MQRSLSYRIELLFYDVIINILSKSAQWRNAVQKIASYFQSGEWIVLAGSFLASSLAGLITGFVLYFLFGLIG